MAFPWAAAAGAAASVLGGSGGESSITNIERIDILTDEQKQALGQLMTYFGGSSLGPAPTSPNAYVPRTGEEQNYFNFINSLSGSRGKALTNLIEGKPLYDINADWANNYFEQSVKPSYLKEFNEVTLPGIQTAFNGPTFWGTGRQNALTRASENLGTTLGSEKAKLLYDTELARRTALENSANRVTDAIGTKVNTLSQAGNLSRSIDQEKVASDLGKFLMGESVNGSYNPAYNPSVAIAMNLLGIQGYGYGSVSKTFPQADMLSQLLPLETTTSAKYNELWNKYVLSEDGG